jgi:two-component system, OmpR family, response regulator
MTIDRPITVTLVEDNAVLLEELIYQLMLTGFSVRGVSNADELDTLMQQWQSDIYVLDINLPGENGFSIAKRLINRKQRGIIMLTARSDISDKLQSLEDGVDFYLTKPVDWRELSVCIKNLYARINLKTMSLNWCLVLSARQLVAPDNRILNLTIQDVKVLQVLLESPEKIIERDVIETIFKKSANDIDGIYGRVNTKMSRLRDKLSDFEPTLIIQTHRGVGYALVGPSIQIKAC